MSVIVSEETATFFAYLAINTLLSKLNKISEVSNSDIAKAIDYPNFDQHINAPLFVTWNILKIKSNPESIVGRELRGCIGNFSNLKLPQYVKRYAIISAMEDSRFPAMDKYELDEIEHSKKRDLECIVTVLHSFEEITENPLNWIVGTHGISLHFQHRGRNHSSTFLPEVASEQGWTCEDTINALIRKAGISGGCSYRNPEITIVKVERYKGVKGKAQLSNFFEAVL